MKAKTLFLALLSLLVLSPLRGADVKISNLPAATTAASGDLFPFTQISTTATKAITLANLKLSLSVPTLGAGVATYLATPTIANLLSATPQVARTDVVQTFTGITNSPISGSTGAFSQVTVSGGLKSTGYTLFDSGSGPEMLYYGGECLLIGYNRDAAVYLPLRLDGSTVIFGIGGAAGLTLTANNLAIRSGSAEQTLIVGPSSTGIRSNAGRLEAFDNSGHAGSVVVDSDATGTGSIALGAVGTRTTLTGTATANRAIALPNSSGTLLLSTGDGSQLTGLPSFTGGLVTSDIERAASSGAAGLTLSTTGIARTGTGTALSLVIAPKGQGSLVASSTGNARGVSALDLQWTRSDVAQVASGLYSALLGGLNNTASGGESTVGGGEQNVASGNWSWAESYHNIASGEQSHAEGGSTTASGGASHSEGNTTIASGMWSHAEGMECAAMGQGTHAQGMCAIASRAGQHAEAAGEINEKGDAQVTRLVWRGVTTDATETALVFGAGSLPTFDTDAGKSYFVTVDFCGRALDASGGHARLIRQAILSNSAGVTSLDASGVVTVGTDVSTLAVGGVNIVTAGDATFGLHVTGNNSGTPIAWVARLDAVEIKYVSIAPTVLTAATLQDAGPGGTLSAPRGDSDTLTVSGMDATFAGVPTPAISHDWQRSNDGGSTWTSTGGTDATYMVSSAGDAGYILRVVTTATNSAGSASSATAPTGTVVP